MNIKEGLFFFILNSITITFSAYIIDFFGAIFLYFLSLFGYNLFHIYDNDVKRLRKRVYGLESDINGDPVGFIYGFYGDKKMSNFYIGKIICSKYVDRPSWCLCTRHVFENLTVMDIVPIYNVDIKDIKQVTIYYKSVMLFDGWSKSITSMAVLSPTIEQKEIIDQIIDFYDKYSFCVIFIDGDTMTGKSTIARIVSTYYSSYYVFNHDPTCPGDDLFDLRLRINPTKEKPLVVSLEEVDTIINKLDKTVIQHPKYRIPIVSKTDWNNYLDKINDGVFPFIILIMTSNKSIKEFNKQDESLFRKNRVNIYGTCKKKIEKDLHYNY